MKASFKIRVFTKSHPPDMSAFHEETVLTVHHWTDRLFMRQSEMHKLPN
jgi:hypothetical protein